MTLIIIAFILWGLVVFMALDDHCRNKERNALGFLIAVSIVLTFIGISTFKVAQISNVSVKDWALLGFFPIILMYLALKSQLVKIQSEALGKEITLAELDLAQISDNKLVGRFHSIKFLMWIYAVLLLVVIIWGEFGKSI